MYYISYVFDENLQKSQISYQGGAISLRGGHILWNSTDVPPLVRAQIVQRGGHILWNSTDTPIEDELGVLEL